jgi:hypothetical protein
MGVFEIAVIIGGIIMIAAVVGFIIWYIRN